VANHTHLTTAKKLWTYNATRVWDVPQSVDWAGSALVPSVIHHGSCGSCFAAAAKDALESAYYREMGRSASISMQVRCVAGVREFLSLTSAV